MKPTTAPSTLVKESMEITPHKTNAAEMATVAQNTTPNR